MRRNKIDNDFASKMWCDGLISEFTAHSKNSMHRFVRGRMERQQKYQFFFFWANASHFTSLLVHTEKSFLLFQNCCCFCSCSCCWCILFPLSFSLSWKFSLCVFCFVFVCVRCFCLGLYFCSVVVGQKSRLFSSQINIKIQTVEEEQEEVIWIV